MRRLHDCRRVEYLTGGLPYGRARQVRSPVALFVALSVAMSAAPAVSTASDAAARPLPPDLRDVLARAEVHRSATRYREADSLAWLAAEILRANSPRSERERLRAVDGIVACALPTTAEGCDSVAAWARWAAERHDLDMDGSGREQAWLAAARAYRRAGKADSFLVCADRAATALHARKGRTPSEEARLFGILATQYLSAERSREMERSAGDAIAAWNRDPTADSLLLATALVPRARVRLERSVLDSARTDLMLALGIRLRRTGPNDGNLVFTWRSIATLRALSNDLSGALDAINEAIRITGLTRAPGDPDFIHQYAQASAISSAGGNLVEACRFGRLAVAASEKRFGPLNALTASSKLSLANALSHLGDIAGALEEGRAAVEIQRQILKPESGGRAYGLSTLGGIELAAGQYAESFEHYRESARIREAILGADHMLVLYSLSGQAEAGERLGRLEEARELLERVARSQESRGLLKQLLESLNALARVYHGMGRDSLALTTLNRGVAISDSIYGPGAAPAPDPRLQRVVVLRALGRRHEAFDEAVRLAASEREHVWRAVSGVSEREGLAAAEVRSQALSAALEIAAETPRAADTVGRVWAELSRSRALVFHYQAERRARSQARPPEATRQFAVMDSARATLARETLADARVGGSTPPARLDSLRRTVEDAERMLAATMPDARPAPMSAGLMDGLAKLGPRERLVSFARVARLAADRLFGSGNSDSEFIYLALVGGKDGRHLTIVPLGDASVIDERVERWNSLVRRPTHDAAGEAALERRVVEAGAAIRRALWDPLAKALTGARRVYVVPDGSVANVDFATLPLANGTYLAESGPLLISLSTERDLEASAHAGSGLLAMGGADFDIGSAGRATLAADGLRSTGFDSLRLRFEPLPESGAEAKEAVEAWGAGTAGEPANRLLLGRLASEEEFRRDAPSRAILHLATHGFIAGGATAAESGDPTRRGVGALVGSPKPGRALAGAVDWSVAGLALAGANGVGDGSSREDDGLLTGAEIAALDLSRVRCAVLSACRTGVARADQLESIQGLERGLRLAGVGQVVMSLWPVEDADARSWMRAFYRAHLGRGLEIAEAVHAADLERLRDLRSEGRQPRPHRWAPFFVRGERGDLVNPK